MITDEDFLALAKKKELTFHDFMTLIGEDVGVGEHGSYSFTTNGIHAASVTDEELAKLTHAEQLALLRHREETRLDFPCTPADLVAWIERQTGEFVLPVGFVEAVRSQHGLSRDNARRGGRRPKYDTGLQEAINRIAIDLVDNGKKITQGNIKDWFAAHDAIALPFPHKHTPYEFDPLIPSCDDLYIDGNKLVWKDRHGREQDKPFRSLEPYIKRAKEVLIEKTSFKK